VIKNLIQSQRKIYGGMLYPAKSITKPKFFINQRPPAERGPFQGPSSYPQLCWWSLIYPKEVVIEEQGLRDGLQSEKALSSTPTCNTPKNQTVDNSAAAQTACTVNSAGNHPGSIKTLQWLERQIENLCFGVY
jgi:hypothetical protein